MSELVKKYKEKGGDVFVFIIVKEKKERELADGGENEGKDKFM